MDTNNVESHYNFKGLIKYISTVISWTIFVILIIIGLFLLYYYISIKLYSTKGEAYEPIFSVYTIVSGSMEPTISKYDVIINTKTNDSSDIKINDVITFISTSQVTYGMTITHRVIGIQTLDDGSICYITRGDDNSAEDQACVSESNVIGVVKAVIPGLGKIQEFLTSTMGWLFLIMVIAIYIIVKDIVKLFNLNNKVPENSILNYKIEPLKTNKGNHKNKKLEDIYKDLKKMQ